MSSHRKKAQNKAVAKLAANRTHTQSLTSVKQTTFQGPLPPPEVLRQYDQLLPGAAERIISMWENQARHRQQLEKDVIASDIKDSKLGLTLGFIVAVVAVTAGMICILMGHTIGGSIVGGSAVPALVGVFVYGSRQRRNEREAQLHAQLSQGS
jgi:uncharacterized membrane protein